MSVFEAKYTVSGAQADCFGVLKASGVLEYLEGAAAGHVAQCGYGREEILRQRGVVWVLSRIRFTLTRAVRAEETVAVRTWLRGTRGVAAFYRDSDLFVKKERVGTAVARWTWLDLDTGTLLRPELPAGLTGGEARGDRLPRLTLPAMGPARTRLLYYSDSDRNRHVHNTRYADFACDALELHARGGYAADLQLNFLAQSRAGETLYLTRGARGDVDFVSGSDVNGKQHFEAAVTIKTI